MNGHDFLAIGLTNAALASAIAAAGWLLTRLWPNPHVASIVWLAVLLKLVTPPVVALPVVFDLDVEQRSQGSGLEQRGLNADATGVSLESTVEAATAITTPREPVEARRPAVATFPIDKPAGWASEHARDERPIAERPPLSIENVPANDEIAADMVAPFDEASPGEMASVISTPTERSSSWKTIAITGWMTGTVLFGLISLVRIVRFHRGLRSAAAVDHDMQRAAVHVASRLGLKKCPAVRSVAAKVGPMVWAGSLRPLVIVPRPLWNSLSDDERETLLAHELAHVVRRDHWVRRFEAVVLTLYWWLPTAWLAVRKREVAAETCCDALVLSHYPDRPQAYAEALLTAVTVLSTTRTPALASGLGRNHELKERLTMIVHDRVPQRPGRAVRWGVLLVAMLALAVGASLEPEHAAQASDTPPAAEAAPAEAKASGKAAAAVDEILFFHADWALHAQPMKSFFEKRKQDGLPVRLIDATQKPEAMRSNNVETIPTIAFLKNGKEVDRYVGMADEAKLRELLASYSIFEHGKDTEHAAQASGTTRETPASDSALPAASSDPAAAVQVMSRPPAVTVDEITVLFLHAAWSGPSQQMKPIIEKLKQEGLPFRIVDVDRERELAKSLNVTSVPTFVAMRNGEETGRVVGIMSEEMLREAVKPLANSDAPLSRESRKKVIDGLIAVIQNEKQPADVKSQAMRSLGSLAKGTDDEKRVEAVLVEAAEKSGDDQAMLGAAEALHRLGSPKGVELMWRVLVMVKDNHTKRWAVIEKLTETESAPPTPETLQLLARHADGYTGGMTGGRGAMTYVALLWRTRTSADGLRRLIKAIETLGSDEFMNLTASSPERDTLLAILSEATPTSDDIAAVLVEALSHKDADIREAAAKALGNARPAAGGANGMMQEDMYGGSRGPMGGGYRVPGFGGNRGPMGAGGSRGGRGASPMRMRPRGEDFYGAAPAELDPAPSDDTVRKELLDSLTDAGKDEKATPESRVAALTALSRLVKTDKERQRAVEVVNEVLEQATDEKEKSSLGLLAYDLAASDGALPKAFWNGFVTMPIEEAAKWLPRIVASGQRPPDEKSVSRLAYLDVVAAHDRLDKWGGMKTSIEALFERLVADPEGVWRLVEAIPDAKEPEARKVERDGTATELTPKQFGYPSDTPVRDRLLSRLSMIQPTTPDVAKVLAKALSHEDGAIRTAAATALGNYKVEVKDEIDSSAPAR